MGGNEHGWLGRLWKTWCGLGLELLVALEAGVHLPRDGTEVHQHARGCHRLGLTKPEAFLLELSRVTVPLAVGDPSFLARSTWSHGLALHGMGEP